jgi:hypothetical protein
MTLTEEQKEIIRQTYKKSTDLNEIVRAAFEDPNLDGRSKEGRLVRKYMIDAGLKFKTTRRTKKEDLELTDQQREFIVEQANEGLSSLRIAEILFPDKEIKPLSVEQRAVYSVINAINPDYSPSTDTDAN